MKHNPKAERKTEVPTKITTWLLQAAFDAELITYPDCQILPR
jgi:hypothetical protein